jgi:DNA-binding transcriptional regulator LsrR (DeoR family)
LEEINQREIAAKLNVSIASVSRMLNRAKRLGIVRISIDHQQNQYQELEVRLERRFGLRECVVAPSADSAAQTDGAMAHALAEPFSRILNSGDFIGVSWGQTLKRIGEQLPPLELGDIGVVPTIGAMGRIETGIYPNSIARSFAEKLGGVNYLVNTPGVVDSAELRRSVMEDSNFQQVSELWNRLETAIFSVSGLDTDTSVFAAGIFSEAELHEVRNAGAVAALNFAFIDRNGQEVDTPLNARIVKLSMETLRSLPHRVLAARGGNKVEPMLAVLRGGLCDILVTDSHTADALLRAEMPRGERDETSDGAQETERSLAEGS